MDRDVKIQRLACGISAPVLLSSSHNSPLEPATSSMQNFFEATPPRICAKKLFTLFVCMCHP